VMNPFSVDANPDYLLGLTDAVRRVAMSFLRDRSAARRSYSASNPILSAKST
jgi:hypothetical protein